MLNRLSLNQLRVFEATARHLSIVKAAAELNVTPAAVSHQIRVLEENLCVPLFKRGGRTLMLTEAGQACWPGVSEAFDRLAAAMGEIDTLGMAGVLTVSAPPSFAAKWLLPRLDRFHALHADIDVRVSASMQLVDFAGEDVDLAVRYGTGRYPDLTVEHLLTETVVPVCSRQLLKGKHALIDPSALRFHPLLHDDSPDGDVSCPTWAMWLKAAGVADADASRGPRFNQASLAIEAAILGRGVALAKAALAAGDLAAGRLVQPFEMSLPVDFGYYVVCPKAKLNLPKVAQFRGWLLDEAARANRT
ncbi:MAG: transcriptional regulator GcvA [Alphaproteobacteria bacterium]|nr:transcriptional regulator GcvA [Alphaproteobacteria bacterium]